MKEVIILTKFAESMIKEGQYKKAKSALVKAVKLDSLSVPTFALLGDAYYLLESHSKAIQCYLAAIHLQINKFTQMQSATLSTILDCKYKKLDPEIQGILPCKEGMLIYEDSIIPSHIAHAYIDLKKDEPLDPIVKECSKIYKKHLITGKPIKDLMNTSNICYEDYLSFDNSHYVFLGRELILDNIDWKNIHSNTVLKLYFNNK
ncbi:tetratricopeptide repeat protein [Clostridium paraputrificum]|uniref:tetratricopeptide repeat protein n=1 Tax=Clostridium TaxID=1485 RepID=UPI003D3598A4